MSDRLEWFSVTIPAGTAIATPLVTPLVFRQGYVLEIDVKVPSGPSGNVGFFVSAGGTQYVPRTVGSFIVPDNDYFTWPLKNAINSGSWGLTAYNTDVWPHTIQVGFQVDELWSDTGVSGQQLGASSLSIPSSVTSASRSSSGVTDPLSLDFLTANLPPDAILAGSP